jgi:hypothetical protein
MGYAVVAGRAGPVNLAHLTNLTALQVECAQHGSSLAHADVLPSQLQVASLRCCTTLQPLEGMMQLRVLTLGNPPSDELLVLKPLMTGEHLCLGDGRAARPAGDDDLGLWLFARSCCATCGSLRH